MREISAFGLVADVHQHFVGADFEDLPFDDHSLGELLHLGK